MNLSHKIFCFAILGLSSLSVYAQEDQKLFTVSGQVIDAATNQPLEYSSVTLISVTNPDNITGDITDESGKFSFPVTSDTYTITFEFLGYETITLENQKISNNKDLGIIKFSSDEEMLDGIVIQTERAAVEMKLDKRIYNVGNDNVVKGGTASDILDNIPSVEVDSDGNVNLRGNSSVRILINGKPSGMASNIGEALKMMSAETVDRVEVITNPSARYEAEGGGGIINIILKKGSEAGVNGSVTATVSDPEGYAIAASLNLRGKDFNIFANLGYRDTKTYGNRTNEMRYRDENTGATTSYVDEYGNSTRSRNGFDSNIGFEWNLTNKLTWTNNFSWRKSSGDISNLLRYNNYNANRDLLYTNARDTYEEDFKDNVDFSSDLTYNFDDKGHQITGSFQVVKSDDKEDSSISTYNVLDPNTILAEDKTNALEKELNHIFRLDYNLPLGEGSHFEAGYFGSFNNLGTKFNVNQLVDGDLVENEMFRNDLQYKEYVNALYAQYGGKWNKINYMFGLRWEDSNIQVNQLVNQDFNTKRYNNFFPSAFFNYELTDTSSASVNYSRRVRRPRGRMLNPISNYSSSINFFMGNPDLDPSFTDVFELGYMNRIGKFTLNTMAYLNRTTDAVEYVRSINGVNEEGIPITITSPVNLSTEYRYGLEVNFNYNPAKWLRLTGNVNLFYQQTRGDYTFTDFEGNTLYQNFDYDAFNWNARLISRVTLPFKIDWQTNYSFYAGARRAQGRSLDIHHVNMALSRDILKERATVSVNVQDLFNSRKMMFHTDIPSAVGYTEMQWRERTVNISLVYRFNQTKKDTQKNQRSGESFDQEEMM